MTFVDISAIGAYLCMKSNTAVKQ